MSDEKPVEEKKFREIEKHEAQDFVMSVANEMFDVLTKRLTDVEPKQRFLLQMRVINLCVHSVFHPLVKFTDEQIKRLETKPK